MRIRLAPETLGEPRRERGPRLRPGDPLRHHVQPPELVRQLGPLGAERLEVAPVLRLRRVLLVGALGRAHTVALMRAHWPLSRLLTLRTAIAATLSLEISRLPLGRATRGALRPG